jgi:FAD/FMN-containing dehydrogenase
MPYATAQTMVDAWWPHGLLNYWKSSFLPALGDGAIEAIVAHFAAVPSPRTVVTIEQFGGAMRHVAPGATAFAQRGWDFNVDITSMWTDPTQTAANVAWTRAAWEALRPFVPEAVYVNYLGVEGEERVRAAYGANYDRLVALKKAYDPTNVFRLNQNIPPTAGTRH